MFARHFLIALSLILSPLSVMGQKNNVAAQVKAKIEQAKANVKAGKQLAETEASMRKLLADSANRSDVRIWLVLFDAVKKQYDASNEQIYLKHTADTAQLFDAARRMFVVLEGLDSIDACPDSKGEVRLKYRKKHSALLDNYRPNIFSGGLFHFGHGNYARALGFFETYIDCVRQPLFGAYDYLAHDKRLSTAAYYATVSAYRVDSTAATLRYAPLVDSTHQEQVTQYVAETLRRKGDAKAYESILQKAFCKWPGSQYFFSRYFDCRFKSGDTLGSLDICRRALEASPRSVAPMLAKSTVLLALARYDECLDMSRQVLAIDSAVPEAWLNAGLAYFNQAVPISNDYKLARQQREHLKQLYRQALPYMQRYRQLAPDQKQKWAMPLYTIYLNLNMGKEFDEMDEIIKKGGF